MAPEPGHGDLAEERGLSDSRIDLAIDEAGHFWLQVLPVGDGDRRAELQEA